MPKLAVIALALLVPLLAPLPTAQDSDAVPPSPFDEVHVLELTDDSPRLVDGRGPTTMVELEIGFSGTLHLWTRSELDLFLRVEDASDGSLLAEDDDSGGGNVPYVRRDVEEGARLIVLIASTGPDALGPLELHAVAAPETEATREVALRATDGLAETQRLQQEGDPDAARSLIAALVSELVSTPGSRASEAIAEVCWQLGFPASEAGDPASCRAAWEVTRNHRERTLPADHPDLLASRENLAVTMREQGDVVGARALFESVLAARERTLSADDPALFRARQNLAVTMWQMGDLAGARAIFEAVLAAHERALPADHPDVLIARQNLAATLSVQGDLPGARALFEAVLAARERTLPADHPDVLAGRQNLALVMKKQGDLGGARALEESVLEARERTLPADHPDLLSLRGNLADTLRQMGDLPGARALFEAVLAAHERTLPADHPDLLGTRHNLAVLMNAQGDLPGARTLFEAVLAAYERTLPADHPSLLLARLNLAVLMKVQGDLPGARALFESVLAAHERTFPADHPDLLLTRLHLAGTLNAQGDLPGARALQESVLEVCERTLPAGHPYLLDAEHDLAMTLAEMGDLPAARALRETVLEARQRTLPADHRDLLAARQNLATTMAEMGDLAGARDLVGPQVAGMRALVLGALVLSPRQATEAFGSVATHLAQALFLTSRAAPDLQAPVFELQETMRLVAGEAARALRAVEDPDIRSLLGEAATVRSALGDLYSRSASLDASALSAELTRLMQERDRLEREASRLQAERGVATRGVEIGALARALGEGAALVTYRRIVRAYQAEGRGPILLGSDHLLAHVLAADGSLARIDLGEAAELEELVVEWRQALGRPLQGRGLSMDEESATSGGDRLAGELLRERLVDPILAHLDEKTDTLHVCADDLVFLVPIDALPIEGEVLGDRYRFVNEVSCARLVSAAASEPAAPGLLLVGGVDYDAGAEAPYPVIARAEVDLYSGDAAFPPLPGTQAEADALRRRFDEVFEAEAVVLTEQAATKETLADGVGGKRWVHVATHGWFVSETTKSTLDEQPDERGWTSMGVEERVTGMAPMLLCGLALAGANRPIDSLGRRPGILRAEELCSLDLRSCELAVLSACETNVGIRRAGQGIQSLQAALYAAGARSSITSLWKVDDAATRRLFELFYTKLWEEKQPKAQALWEAKRALRDEGAPARDWAAWVLTGDPE